MQTQIRHIKLHHSFSESELNDICSKLADFNLDIERFEQEKKESAKSYKEKIDFLQLQAIELSHQYKNGGEEKLTECEVIFDYPADGLKTVKRTDTGEEWVEEMSTNDEPDLFTYSNKHLPESQLKLLPAEDYGYEVVDDDIEEII